jgi:hypothetical protein
MNALNRKAQFRGLPLRLNIKEVARRLGYRSETAARNACRRHHYKWLAGVEPTFSKRRVAAYGAWDWSRLNTQLASEHGVSRQAVAQMRKRLEDDGQIPHHDFAHDNHLVRKGNGQ